MDILRERDALRARLTRLEAEMATVNRETEYALRFPEINLLVLCRIGTIARRALHVAPPSQA